MGGGAPKFDLPRVNKKLAAENLLDVLGRRISSNVLWEYAPVVYIFISFIGSFYGVVGC